MLLDVFNNDAFSVVEMTAAIQAIPYTPGLIGQVIPFDDKPIRSSVYSIESQGGELRLVPEAPRGVHNRVLGTPTRTMRNFNIPHFPLDAAVYADDINGLRQFGDTTGNNLVSVQNLVLDKMRRCRLDHEATHEYMRVNAIQGVLYNAQGDVITNLFTEFGVTEQSTSFNFNGTLPQIKAACTTVVENIEAVLNGVPYTGIVAMLGTTAWKNFVSSAAINSAFTSQYPSLDPTWPVVLQRRGFSFANISWFPYRGKVGSTPYIPANVIRFFPIGVADLYQQVIAPADFVEAVGAPGELVYAKQELMPMGKGVQIHTQSNVHMLVTRPKVLQKGTDDTV
jgi:hypothetical protein